MIKPGYKTTEFSLVLLTIVGQLAATLSGVLSPHWAALTMTVSTAAYALARSLAKWNEPKAASAQANRDAVKEVGLGLSQLASIVEMFTSREEPPPPAPAAEQPTRRAAARKPASG